MTNHSISMNERFCLDLEFLQDSLINRKLLIESYPEMTLSVCTIFCICCRNAVSVKAQCEPDNSV